MVYPSSCPVTAEIGFSTPHDHKLDKWEKNEGKSWFDVEHKTNFSQTLKKKKDFVYFITAKQPPACADKTKTIGDWKGAM